MTNDAQKLRPEIDEYFLKIAKVVGQRSTCLRHNIGAVLVRDKQIISTGYNGAPAGLPDCLEIGCLKDQNKILSGTGHDVCRAVHAEQNAIIQAALHGTSTQGGTLYTTHAPCLMCSKIIINAGIKRVVSIQEYTDGFSETFLKKAGVAYDFCPEPSLEIGDVGERVLVVERELFESLGAFEGIKITGIKTFYNGLLSGVRYVFREKAEHDKSTKQIISQFIIRYDDEFYISKRLVGSDEERLRDIYYLSFGGHINPVDSSEKTGDVIEKPSRRELAEEVECDIKNIKFIGFVNDEQMAVSQYHLGVIYVVDVKNKKCSTVEADQLEGHWVKRKDMGKYFDNGDSWSRHIYKELIKTGKI
jgi:dCMP deaminase